MLCDVVAQAETEALRERANRRMRERTQELMRSTHAALERYVLD
jgi:hypothetical protein